METNQTSISSGAAVYEPVAGDENKPLENSNKSFFKGILSGLSFIGCFRPAGAQTDHQNAANKVAQEIPITTECLSSSRNETQPKTSLTQRIKSFFFGSSATESSRAPTTKGTSLLSWLSSKMFGPKTITFGNNAKIPESGSWEFTAQDNPDQIEIFNTSLDINAFREEKDVSTFDKDATRRASHTLSGGSNLSTVQIPGTTDDGKQQRVAIASKILSELSNLFFPVSKTETASTQSANLQDDLKLLNSQGLLAGAAQLFASEAAPKNVFFPGGGFNGNFTYSKTEEKEITITAKGKISLEDFSVTSSSLTGNLNGQITPLFSEHHTTSGTLELVIKANIGEDGHITSLTCQSAKGSYQVHQNNT